ncbi:MAG TPA: 2-C-methyl-D-erythritol 2,4-cyclodiphosphate synthase [Acidimicrobiia bacterium]
MNPHAPAGRSRTGWALDAHRLGGEPPLLLGGVVVSHHQGVLATSDGDVLAHAVTDAILGACVLGDMGEWFPSADQAYSGADSMALLRRAVAAGRDAGWVCSHVDATVIVEEVRVAPHRSGIRAGIADALGLPVDQVSVKATTTDGLGLIGEGRAIAVVAIVTVDQVPGMAR